ncbi:helicase [Alphaproteobacteria bacterium]|nr:helicase [Alphaproteobacteria bacterium]
MVKKTYGRTWWGQKWLDTFNGIDDENRLPRGKTYANKGAASNIKILGNRVTARVQGSRPTPYKVTITFEQFTQKQKDILRQLIEKSPSILSALMNKRLPVKLYEELRNVGIKLFPEKWKDVQADCSCPDWAIPCKHIAAVLYLICDEIDKNPFVVFDLHDCNILELLLNFDAGNSLNFTRPILKVEDLLGGKKSDSEFDQSILDDIDLSKIQDLVDTTFRILKSNVVFYEKNFLEKMKTFYDLLHFRRDRELPEEKFVQKYERIETWNTFKIFLDREQKITEIYCPQEVSQHISSNLFEFFQEMPMSLLRLLTKELCFAHMVFQFTTKLMEKRALIPQIMQNSSENTFIRWIPSTFNDEIRGVMNKLAQTCPQIINGMHDPHEQINTLVAIFVASRKLSLVQHKLSDDLVLDLFFGGKVHKFSSFSQKEIPNAINQWLSNLYLTKKSHKLYLEIEDKDEAFQLDLKVMRDNFNEPIALEHTFKDVSPSEKFEILSDVSALAEHLPQLEDIIDNNEPAIFDMSNFTDIFLTILPVLKSVGVSVALPKSLREIFSPKLSLNLSATKKIKDSRQSFMTLDSLLNFDWTIAVGDQNLTLEEFKKLIKKSRGLVRFANNYILLDEKKMESLLKQFESLPQSLSQADLMQAALAEEFESASVVLDDQLKKLFSEMKTYKPQAIPSNLKAQLRPYQERGFSWLVQNMDIGFGSILADDMGLGKTLQVIAAVLHLKNNGLLNNEKVLVVAPTTLLTNWSREIAKFAPDLNALIYHGNKREFSGDFDIVLTSYGLAFRDLKEFKKQNWFLLVIDEAQNIKNPLTKQTKAVKAIEAKHKIAMSGTPVENRLLEYWSIFDFTNKNYLGTHGNFSKKFAAPIEKERDKDCLDRFLKVTSPFILRRCKSDKSIIDDLPEKLENNKYCTLTKEQAAIYQEILNSSMEQIAKTEGIDRKGLVLKLINSLKQICNHPAQFGKKPNATLDESGKSKMLEEILEEIHESGEKTLIFTQYVEMGNILATLLEEKFQLPTPFMHGGLSRPKRDEIVTDFQEHSQTRTLIVSLKAGGTGLNLTAANHVIHYDLWWNPAVEAQATDRAYRIGQKNNVMVHRLLTTGTFEERIDEMIQSKKDLANLTVSSGEKWITEFDNTQLHDLFALRQA